MTNLSGMSFIFCRGLVLPKEHPNTPLGGSVGIRWNHYRPPMRSEHLWLAWCRSSLSLELCPNSHFKIFFSSFFNCEGKAHTHSNELFDPDMSSPVLCCPHLFRRRFQGLGNEELEWLKNRALERDTDCPRCKSNCNSPLDRTRRNFSE